VVFIATADAESSATVVQLVHTAVIARREAAMQPQLAVAKHLPKQLASTRSVITKFPESVAQETWIKIQNPKNFKRLVPKH
jgi:hypothetical protein